jgi:vacuolar-type H+-ATPase subunit E/Vma4
MALQDILDAITADADRQIAGALDAHKLRMKAMREENEREIEAKRTHIGAQKEQKKRLLREKTASYARMTRAAAVTAKKQECMGDLYVEVLKQLTSLPKEKTESFLKKCLERLKGEGTVHPAKSASDFLSKHLPKGCVMGSPVEAQGGFVFVSQKVEQDFTYEFVVEKMLRAQTEVEVAKKLFI